VETPIGWGEGESGVGEERDLFHSLKAFCLVLRILSIEAGSSVHLAIVAGHVDEEGNELMARVWVSVYLKVFRILEEVKPRKGFGSFKLVYMTPTQVIRQTSEYGLSEFNGTKRTQDFGPERSENAITEENERRSSNPMWLVDRFRMLSASMALASLDTVET
jgi:hypothetical protein